MSGHRIGWLDSCRMPSRVHRTLDGGTTTVCKYRLEPLSPAEKLSALLDSKTMPDPRNTWTPSRVPTSDRGQKRFCKVCFKEAKHKVPWLPGLPEFSA